MPGRLVKSNTHHCLIMKQTFWCKVAARLKVQGNMDTMIEIRILMDFLRCRAVSWGS